MALGKHPNLQESVNDLDYKPGYNPWRNSASPHKKNGWYRFGYGRTWNAWTFLDRQGCCRHVKAWSDQLAASGLGVLRTSSMHWSKFMECWSVKLILKVRSEEMNPGTSGGTSRSICMINLLFHIQKKLFFKVFEFFQWHPTNYGCFMTINVL